MNEEQKIERLVTLFHLLQFSSQERCVFTSGERMMINQERASLLYALDFKKAPIKFVSPKIEAKIQDTLWQMFSQRWRALEVRDPFLSEYKPK